MKWVGHVACKGLEEGAYRVLVGKPEGRRPLGRPGIDWRIILRWIFGKLVGGDGLVDMAKDRDRWRPLVNAVMNFWVP